MKKSKGKEIPFWQSEWLDISFKDLNVKVSSQKIASSNFYSAFYSILFEKYKNYNELPLDWKKNKELTAEQISKEIPTNAEVLSYGCGTGYIENLKTISRKDIKLRAFDFSETVSKWINSNSKTVEIINQLESLQKFDVIYVCQVLYALASQDCKIILTELNKCLKEKGKIVIINSSYILAENGYQVAKSTFLKNLLVKIKNILRPSFMILKNLMYKNKFQFWGWERDNAKINSFLQEANFNTIKTYSHAKQSFITAIK